MSNESKLRTNLTQDTPLVQDATYVAGRDDRQKLDNQIQAIQDHLVETLLGGVHATWFWLSGSSSSVSKGDVLCLSTESAINGVPVVAKLTGGSLSGVKSATGIAMTTGVPGTRIRVAISGVVPTEVSGLGTGTVGTVRMNTSTARPERHSPLELTDFPLGVVDGIGNLSINCIPQPGLIETISGSTPTFTLDGASPALVSGDIVCVKSGTNVITKGTNAALRAAGGPFGIVSSSWNPGDTTVIVHVSGDIVDLTAALSAPTDGLAHDVMIDALARPQWLYSPTGAEFVIGHADANRKLTVSPKSANITAPIHTFNPLSFGCLWDGIHDDLPGWEAMRAYINALGGNVPVIIDIPSGYGWFSDHARVTGPWRVRGRGGNSLFEDASGGFKFAPLKGLRIDGAFTTPEAVASHTIGPRGDFAAIEGVNVKSTAAIVIERKGGNSNGLGFLVSCLDPGMDLRTASTVYRKGQCVLPAGSTGGNSAGSAYGDGAMTGGTAVMFRAISVTGDQKTGAGGAPAGFASTNLADGSFVDGNVTWKIESVPKDYLNNHAYVVGQRVSVPGSPTWIFECAVAGTSKAFVSAKYANVGIPVDVPDDFFDPNLDETIADNGTLRWKAIQSAGIMVLANSVTVRDVFISGATGFAIHVTSHIDTGVYPGAGSAHFFDHHKVTTWNNGGGFLIIGGDANACHSHVLNSNRNGIGRTIVDATLGNSKFGNGSAAIWDRSQSSNMHTRCYQQFSPCPGFRNDYILLPATAISANSALFEGCNAESDYPNRILSGYAIYCTPGQAGQQIGAELVLDRQFGRGIIETDWSDAKTVQAGLVEQTGRATLFFRSATDDANQRYSMEYQTNALAVILGNGWWSLRYGNSNPQVPIAFSGTTSAEGPGHARFPRGFYVGLASGSKHYQGLDADAICSKYVGDAQRGPGDRFRVKDSAVGTWCEYVCTGTGPIGVAWAANTLTQAANAPTGQPAHRVVPSATVFTNGIPAAGAQVWKVTGGTGSEPIGAVEPTWPGSPTIGVTTVTSGGGVIYTYEGAVPAFGAATSFLDDPVIAYEPRAHSRAGAGGSPVVPTCIVDCTRLHLPSTDATANQIVETYTVPANTAECVDFLVVAKLQSGLGSAGWKVTVGVERNGSGAAALKYNPTPTLLWATDGLSTLVPGSISAAVSATTGAIDFRITGIAATSIHWEVVRQSLEAT